MEMLKQGAPTLTLSEMAVIENAPRIAGFQIG